MTEIAEADLLRLAEIFSSANTPFFLFRKFRADSLVMAISFSKSIEEIVAAYHDTNKPQTIFRTIERYALLVALLIKVEPSVPAVAMGLQSFELDWFYEIREYGIRTRKSTNIVSTSSFGTTIEAPAQGLQLVTQFGAPIVPNDRVAEPIEPFPTITVTSEPR